MKKIQTKLIQIFLIVSTLPLLAVSAITVLMLHSIAVSDVRQRIDHNINMAQTTLEDIAKDLKYIVRDQNRRVYTLAEEGRLDELTLALRGLVKDKGLDFFIVTDGLGREISPVNKSEGREQGINLGHSIQKALQGEILVSTEILGERELRELGLFDKAKIQGVDITKGMVILAALPVVNREEKITGAMSAGYLLNNNNSMPAQIKKVTGFNSFIFLEDITICSNMPHEAENSFIGRRLYSKEVSSPLKEGRRYIGRISSNNKWHMAGYLPVYNDESQPIGNISINIPEVEVFELRDDLIRIFAAAVLFSIFLALAFGIVKGRNIVRSIEKLRTGAEAISKGEFEYTISVDSKDEIENLANVFNNMTRQLKSARQQIQSYSRQLEEKVDEKTLELKTAQEQLVQFEKMAAMGRMATTLGHELRNVFAGIHTITYWLKGRAVKNYPELLNSVKDLEYEVNYANEILDNVLRFSRPQKPVVSNVDLNLIINDIINSLNLEDMFKNIEVTKKLDPELPVIRADGIQIKEVILNIVINAVQAMPKGGSLAISAKKDSGGIKVVIVDTGTGISEETMNNLFTPFFTTKNRGLGLGLCISKEIIEAHKGIIEVETKLNKGTKFIITLPQGRPE